MRKPLISVLIITCCTAYYGVTGQTSTQREETTALNFLALVGAAEGKATAKQWDEAIALWERVVKANPVQVRYWRALANTAYQAKNYRKAIPAYEKVIELGGGIPSNAAYAIACCYALLGEKERALEWLAKAFDMGFRNLANAQNDLDLQSLRDDPRYQQLVGIADVSRMSREEGWRYDLNLFAREVKRRGFTVPRKISPTEFDRAVKQLSDSISKLTDVQLVIEFAKLAVKVGDGHTRVTPGPASRAELHPTLPLKFYLFKEGLYIIAADPKLKDLLGAEVLRFGDRTVAEVVEALTPSITRDASDMWIKEQAPYLMRSLPLLNGLGLIPRPGEVQLAIRDRSGKTSVVTVAADMSQPNIWNVQPNPKSWTNFSQLQTTAQPLYLKKMDQNYWFEYLPEKGVVYFQFNTILDDKTESIEKFAARLFQFIDEHKVEKLIIDMRWNNGGNASLIQPLLKGLISNPKVDQPGKLFIIIGRRTFSAAQTAAAYFERFTTATFVGEPSGSSPNFVGDNVFFTLPYSKLAANVSDVYWQGSNGFDFRTWIAPQIYIEPTFEAYCTNRDPAVEAILALSSPPNP